MLLATQNDHVLNLAEVLEAWNGISAVVLQTQSEVGKNLAENVRISELVELLQSPVCWKLKVEQSRDEVSGLRPVQSRKDQPSECESVECREQPGEGVLTGCR
jgi:hypothetical protein